MCIHQLLTTFSEELEGAIKTDSEKWLPDQERNAYPTVQNLLDHVNYILDFDPTGDTGAEDDYRLPCEWSSEGEGV